MMRAAVVREFGRPLVIEEMVAPRPGPGEVLVRIEATGVCHLICTRRKAIGR
jgi:propanol-preferring alcohol dehydrogenase